MQSLLRSLTPLIAEAKAGSVLQPIDSMKIPGAYNFSEGRYIPYRDPSVDSAYPDFVVEMRGGLTEEDGQHIARQNAMRKIMTEGIKP